MLNRILAVFSVPKITPILLKRPSKFRVVILRDSSLRTEAMRPVYGRMA
jgi:hypothetical protein